MKAGRTAQIGVEDFYKTFHARSQPTYCHIRQAMSMPDFVLEFLLGLPYKSQLMALTNKLWASWSSDQQDVFLKGVEAKINLYAEIRDWSARWVQLHPGDEPDEFVYPIALDHLP